MHSRVRFFATQLTADLDAVNVRHYAIENRERGCALRVQRLPRVLAVMRDDDVVAPLFQVGGEDATRDRIILSNQNLHGDRRCRSALRTSLTRRNSASKLCNSVVAEVPHGFSRCSSSPAIAAICSTPRLPQLLVNSNISKTHVALQQRR